MMNTAATMLSKVRSNPPISQAEEAEAERRWEFEFPKSEGPWYRVAIIAPIMETRVPMDFAIVVELLRLNFSILKTFLLKYPIYVYKKYLSSKIKSFYRKTTAKTKVKPGIRLSMVVESEAEANNSPVIPNNCTINLYILHN